MKGKLKPCPFCGEKAVMFKRLSWRFVPKKERTLILWEVGCQNSSCICWIAPKGLKNSENGFVIRKEAISAWNRRAK